MSGIFGIHHRDGKPVSSSSLQTMRESMAHWGRDGGDIWCDGAIGLGQVLSFNTPEAHFERLPRLDGASGVAITAAARVDNRTELGEALGILPAELASRPDSDLILRAYGLWGEDCPQHIIGDWSFAIWHPAERRLFLARDHHGQVALYYYADERIFAFASDHQALLALKLAPVEIDELVLAGLLVSWPGWQGERTIHKPFKRLPPAHTLSVTPDRLEVRQYWYLERVPELRLPAREDYYSAFLQLFDEAVRCRLRTGSQNTGNLLSRGSASSVGVTLSGGLDSGSVAATAALLLRREGRRLAAFTSAPLSDTRSFVGQAFGDELPFASKTAQHAGNVDLQAIRAETASPIAAIRRSLQIHSEPGHATGNHYWILDLLETAQRQGCSVLLTGQMGNASISWTGSIFSQPASVQRRRLGIRNWAKSNLMNLVPAGLGNVYRRTQVSEEPWRDYSAIHPNFARRLNLREILMHSPESILAPTPRDPRQVRYRIFKPGRSTGGALWAENSAAYGIDVRDPTGDARLLEFTIAVPDRIFIDPVTGMNRWLIRAAMKDRLPEEVRLNRRRGRQAGDLVPRLRQFAGEVEEALAELETGPAKEYVEIAYMREAWQIVRTQDSPSSFRMAVAVLTRGIGAGLWVNNFYEGAGK